MTGDTPRLRAMSIGDMFDTAFRLYRENFLTFVGIVALLQVPMVIITFLVQFGLGSQWLQDVMRFSSQPPLPSARLNPLTSFPLQSFIAFYGITLMLSAIQYLIVQNLISGALANAIARRYLSRPISILEAYGFGARRFFSLLAASLMPFLLGLIVSALIIGCSTGTLATMSLSPDQRPAPGVILIVVLALLAALLISGVLGLWLITRLLITTQAIILEGCGPLTGLRRSWGLIGGSFWRTLGILLLMFLLVYLLVSIPALLVSFTANILTGGALNYVLEKQAITTLVASVGQILIMPLQLSIYTLLYYDLRVRKEGYDMELLAQQAAQG